MMEAWMHTHYSDYLKPYLGFNPVMTEAGIEGTEWWNNFFPHRSFVGILRALFNAFDKRQKSIWISGAYGTGKSHATLVIRKLLTDDAANVRRFCANHRDYIDEELERDIFKWRGDGEGGRGRTLVIYAYGTDTVRTPEDLLARIENAVMEACECNGLTIPVRGTVEETLKTVEECEQSFFRVCEEECIPAFQSIRDCAALRAHLRADVGVEDLMGEILLVLGKIGFHKALSADKTLKWVGQIVRANPGWGRVLFLWDEFSDYIEYAEEGRLKTFEMLSESEAQANAFFFVPVTHKQGEAFRRLGQTSAKKVLDRYTACPIEIPPNQVYALGAKALVVSDPEAWERVRAMLWEQSLARLVENDMIPVVPPSETFRAEDLRALLPLHPMSVYLLCALAKDVGSNQRSFFDYLCDANAYQRFLREGGPAVSNRQYATIDWLWDYFMENPDRVQEAGNDLLDIRATYARHANTFSPEEDRVCKATLLFLLLDASRGRGTALLDPTVENVRRAFVGDGEIIDVRPIIETLADKHCFALRNDDTIERWHTKEVDSSKYLDQFAEIAITRPKRTEAYLLGDNKENKQLTRYLWGDPGRYEIRVVDGSASLTIPLSVGKDFDRGGNKIGVYCLLFCDAESAAQAAERMRQAAEKYRGRRIVLLAFPEAHFCSERADAWKAYCEDYARMEEGNGGVDNSAMDRVEKRCEAWAKRVSDPSTRFLMLTPDDELAPGEAIPTCTWGALKERMHAYVQTWFPDSPEAYSLDNDTIHDLKALAMWAKLGLTLDNSKGGQQRNHLKKLRARFGTDFDFPADPGNPLRKMMGVWEERIASGDPCSIRDVWETFTHEPYGLLPNAFSAFVMGLTLRPVLKGRELTLSNGQDSKPLSEEDVAQEIENVIKPRQGGRTLAEWTIRQPSPAVRACAKTLVSLFDLPLVGTVSPERVFSSLGEGCVQRFGKIPFWVLAETLPEDEVEIRDALKQIWRLLKEGARDTSVPEALGKRFLENPALEARLRDWLTVERLTDAFDAYLRMNAADLLTLAETVEDRTQAYRETILERCARDASWLWDKGDFDTALEGTKARYCVLASLRGLCGLKGWVSLSDARARLARDFAQGTFPIALLADRYSFLPSLKANLEAPEPLDDTCVEALRRSLESNKPYIEALVHNATQAEGLEILRTALGPTAQGITDDSLLRAVQAVPEADRSDRRAFVEAVAAMLRPTQTTVVAGLSMSSQPALPPELRQRVCACVAVMNTERAKDLLVACAERFPEVARWMLDAGMEA